LIAGGVANGLADIMGAGAEGQALPSKPSATDDDPIACWQCWLLGISAEGLPLPPHVPQALFLLGRSVSKNVKPVELAAAALVHPTPAGKSAGCGTHRPGTPVLLTAINSR